MNNRNDMTDTCWLYARWIDRDGYGRIWDGKRPVLAHRVMYENLVGEIPEGLTLDHLCKVPRCINPDHLEPVTHKLNMQRRFGVGLCKRGHPLTPDNVYVSVKNKKTGRVGRQCRTCALHSKSLAQGTTDWNKEEYDGKEN